MRIRTSRGYLISLLLILPGYGQHVVLLEPKDAVRIAEVSTLFTSRYAQHGCPFATAKLGPEETDISLRMEDGCTGAVSGWAGDFVVDRRTGEVRGSLDDKIVIDKADPILMGLWREIESSLLSEKEASCLVAKSAKPQYWQRLGVPTTVRFRGAGEKFTLDAIPASNEPAAPQRVLRFQVGRRDYRVWEGRFAREDLSDDVLSVRKLLLKIKRPAELTEGDVLKEVRLIPEVASWLAADQCRGVRLEEDTEGVSYLSVNLFRWCKSESRAQGLASFAVDKRSGEILAPQGLSISTRRLLGFASRLATLEKLRLAARARLDEICK